MLAGARAPCLRDREGNTPPVGPVVIRAQVGIDSRSSGSAVFVVQTRDNRDMRGKIALLIIEKGWTLLQLSYRRRSLEDAFFEVMREHNPLKDTEGKSTGILDKSLQHAVTKGS